MTTPAVELRGITKVFGALRANDDVSLAIQPGTIHALVGENGAGKTTLMRVLYGLLRPEAGEIRVAGRPARIRRPADAIALGIGMVHQHFMLVPPLTVAENITLGREPRGRLGAYDHAAATRITEDLVRRYGLRVEPGARVESLSVGEEQRVEILKVLHHGARIHILDEPTAVLTPQEVDELFGVLRGLRAQGATLVLITHKLQEVMALSDHVSVMRGGKLVGGGPTGELSVGRIAELMVGRPVLLQVEKPVARPGPSLLSVRGLEVLDDRRLPAVRGVSFDVRAGEIVGIAGVEGNGQHELAEAIAGLRRPRAGSVTVEGRRIEGRTAREAFHAGLAHVPADRLKRGLVPDFTLERNGILGWQDSPRFTAPWRLRGAAIRAHCERLLREFDVRPARRLARARTLSGGNQQKLIVGREFTREGKVLLAAHPTRGIDLGAIEFLHRRLVEQREQGKAVLLISADLAELLSLADRVLVLYEGRIVHESTPAETDERTLGLYMTGKGAA
jgi:simple sugar transport system ATP-binding protein